MLLRDEEIEVTTSERPCKNKSELSRKVSAEVVNYSDTSTEIANISRSIAHRKGRHIAVPIA